MLIYVPDKPTRLMDSDVFMLVSDYSFYFVKTYTVAGAVHALFTLKLVKHASHLILTFVT